MTQVTPAPMLEITNLHASVEGKAILYVFQPLRLVEHYANRLSAR